MFEFIAISFNIGAVLLQYYQYISATFPVFKVCTEFQNKISY